MIFIALFVLTVYLILFARFRKRKLSSLRGGVRGIFDGIATETIILGNELAKRYKGKKSRDSPVLFQEGKRRAVRTLCRLNPGERPEVLYTKYLTEKLSLSLMVIAAGTLVAAGLSLKAGAAGTDIAEGVIDREGFNGEAREYNLIAKTEDGEFDIDVTVNPLRLDEEGVNELLPEFYEKLEKILCGENKSPDCIGTDVNLVGKVEGYPFRIEWSSSDTGLIAAGTGKIAEVHSDAQVILTAYVSYGRLRFEKEFALTLVPKTGETAGFGAALEEYVSEQQETDAFEEKWVLPESFSGKEIEWKRNVQDHSMYFFAGVMVVAVVIFRMSDRDLNAKLEERKKKLQKNYPDVIQKLVLFIGAGMTVRGAFQKTALGGDAADPVYEEMIFTCREMKSGISEAVCYDRFGRRCGLQEYIRMATLLGQNIKRGSSNLLERLREEADNASGERIQNCKKACEEAVTKMLLPMVMMLLVVMIMILLPAFSGMDL